MKIRIDKFLSTQAIATRSQAKEMLRAGRVLVNGTPVKAADLKVDPEGDEIRVDGRVYGYQEHLYLMLNKPQGVVSATDDKVHRTVLDLVPPELRRRGLFPAGRLDRDTVGFVLITDDGEFAHNILSPRHHVPKTYEAGLDGPIGENELSVLAQGVVLGDGTKCRPAELTVLQSGERPLIQIVIVEGRYHQIKRMFAAVGRRVLTLKRTKIGGLALDPSLKEGDCIAISPSNLEKIQMKTNSLTEDGED
ncbi:pseudouridylate synthase [[Clostridium] methylpentosum DSM 5476]|uniref:Pseudouridine synthase n=1 Tax=[Clostridium] methylpentosum DSM 5476 TaxID=537013 RepID=C0EB54_9FIRM|nr:pseudouridylate synthase [[Clostridium] methylpentosum DSM 5476]MDY3988038.1 pseudouridine synthase [Massilioclostridium sp.]MEE1491738.1 pseudouridine synthase [Massilioclostridium sp.]